jgi:hypothetical protein
LGLLLSAATISAQQYLVTTVAGGGLPPTPAPALSVWLPSPSAVATDTVGNAYFIAGDCVYKLDGTGVLTRVAGSSRPGDAGDGGPATSAQLSLPTGVAVDSVGDLYIADSGNRVVRKVAADGTISTVPGTVGFPKSVAVDGAGNLYIADYIYSRVRKVAPNGTVTTVAGNGTDGYSGDGGPATGALVNDPEGVAVDGSGNLYIADTFNNVIRKVSVAGTITTVAGNGSQGTSGDGGPATGAELDYPSSVAVDGIGNLYIVDIGGLHEVTVDGIIAHVGGPYDEVAGVAVDTAGTLYFADSLRHVITKVTSGKQTQVAGTERVGGSGDGGPATSAQLNNPAGVAADTFGNLYIADTYNSSIRKVAADGTITTVVDSRRIDWPYGVAVDAVGNLYIADTVGSAVRKVTPDGVVTTLLSGSTPYAVAVDAIGNVYSAETSNNLIRKVTPSGAVMVVAGNGTAGYAGDGGPAMSAQLNSPYGVAVDAAGNLYIADCYNNAIRRVTPGGIISTVAGNGSWGESGDGGPATSARLEMPQSVAVDTGGSLYITGYADTRVRKVTPNGIITTVAGGDLSGYAGDDGPAAFAQFDGLYGVAADAAGNIYVADRYNNAVRMLIPQGTRALLSVTGMHSAGFLQGQKGITYSVVTTNAAFSGPTNGTVRVTNSASTGLTLISMSGTGWNCSVNACSRADAVSPSASYPPIIATADVAADAPSQVSSLVSVTGGGSPATSTSIMLSVLVPPAVPVLTSPADGAVGVVVAPALAWNASTGADSYDVYFGTSSAPPLVTSTKATSYTPASLSAGRTYYWQIVARNQGTSAPSAVWSFTTGSPAVGLRFVPVTPCRVADTRAGATMAGNSGRSFAVPQSGCGIPATAQAYSLNVTAVPEGPLSYLTLWPTGQAQPFVSTLNSLAGDVVANAAIVPAGIGGAVTVYVTDPTDVILDIDGYFDTSASNGLWFYAAPPCRVVDTRGATSTFGGPTMQGGQTRDFPVPLSTCGIPATAGAYSLNFTVVPPGYLGYLSTWPTGQAQPNVSTLNSWKGKVVANAAIVPAGTNDSISVFVSNPTDVILDINGFFGQWSAAALSFYPVTPCRIADTRNASGPFGGPEMGAAATRSFPIPASGCNIPATAAAYSLNVTVVPDGALSYLSVWPAGSAQPLVSTLNSFDGSVVANAAIVPAGTGGGISIYVTNQTQVILDINGYFAP